MSEIELSRFREVVSGNGLKLGLKTKSGADLVK